MLNSRPCDFRDNRGSQFPQCQSPRVSESVRIVGIESVLICLDVLCLLDKKEPSGGSKRILTLPAATGLCRLCY